MIIRGRNLFLKYISKLSMQQMNIKITAIALKSHVNDPNK